MEATEGSEALQVFVYGTLRPGARHPMGDDLAQAADHLGEAWWRGLLFDLGRFPGAVRHAGHFEVTGDLFRMHGGPDDAAAMLARLDAYEELGPGSPGRFVREMDLVRCADGSRTRAWVYRYTGPVARAARIPDGDWLAHRGRHRDP